MKPIFNKSDTQLRLLSTYWLSAKHELVRDIPGRVTKLIGTLDDKSLDDYESISEKEPGHEYDGRANWIVAHCGLMREPSAV